MNNLIRISPAIITSLGAFLLLSGLSGIGYTYNMISKEKITTPKDASLPNMPVRDPFTLKAQADVMRKHTLAMTNNKTFAEMPREIAILDSEGNEIKVQNTSRDIWITATTFITALNLGLLAYGVSGLSILIGLVFVLNGLVLSRLLRNNSNLIKKNSINPK